MNSQTLNLHQTATVAIAPPSIQPQSTNYSQHNFGYFIGIFVVFVIIDFILGCFLRYKSYQKQRYLKTIEIIQEVKRLDQFQKDKT